MSASCSFDDSCQLYRRITYLLISATEISSIRPPDNRIRRYLARHSATYQELAGRGS